MRLGSVVIRRIGTMVWLTRGHAFLTIIERDIHMSIQACGPQW
jgi:hypothetical protein